MTIPSSFLIRCALSAAGGTIPGKAYSVQHVQTGGEFRSASLAEITGWIAEQNLRYLSDRLQAGSAAEEETL